LQVLHERLLQARDVVDNPENGRDRCQPSPTGRPVAAFAGDDLVLPGRDLADENRLQNSDGLDRVDERRQGLFVELLARLVRARLDLIERQQDQVRGSGTRASLRDEGAKAPPETATTRHRPPPLPTL